MSPLVDAIYGLFIVVGSLICAERFFSRYSGFPISSKTQVDSESGKSLFVLFMSPRAPQPKPNLLSAPKTHKKGLRTSLLCIRNRVDAKSGYFLSSDVTRSCPVLYREYSRWLRTKIIASSLLGLQFQVL